MTEKAQLSETEKGRITTRLLLTVDVKQILSQGSEVDPEESGLRSRLVHQLAILSNEIKMKSANTKQRVKIEEQNEGEPERTLSDLQERWKSGDLDKEKTLKIITGEILHLMLSWL